MNPALTKSIHKASPDNHTQSKRCSFSAINGNLCPRCASLRIMAGWGGA